MHSKLQATSSEFKPVGAPDPSDEFARHRLKPAADLVSGVATLGSFNQSSLGKHESKLF